MRYRTIYLAATVAAIGWTPAFAQSLREKAGFGGNLSAIEATAILAAEIRYCEVNSPDFKTNAGPLLVRMHADPKYREIERNPQFARLAPEASALVRERSQGAVVATFCRNVIQRLN
jgi:hypothetical protein